MATSLGGCRQTLTFPPRPRRSPAPSRPLSTPSGERFARSGQWVRDHAALADACSHLHGLAQAMTGDDGSTPVGLVAARLIGSVAAQDSLTAWLQLARGATVRELRDAVRRAREAGSCWPETHPAADNEEHTQDSASRAAAETASTQPLDGRAPAGQTHDSQRLSIHVPHPVKLAFEETLDLYRAVEGRQLAPCEFVEALVVEASSGCLAGQLGEGAPKRTLPDAPPSHADVAGANPIPGQKPETPAAYHDPPPYLSQDESMLRAQAQQAIRRLGLPKPGGNPEALIRRILILQDEVERELGALLARMARTATWRRLGCLSLDSYSESCLGWSRSTARDRLMLHRTLPRLPVLADAGFPAAGRRGLACFPVP